MRPYLSVSPASDSRYRGLALQALLDKIGGFLANSVGLIARDCESGRLFVQPFCMTGFEAVNPQKTDVLLWSAAHRRHHDGVPVDHSHQSVLLQPGRASKATASESGENEDDPHQSGDG